MISLMSMFSGVAYADDNISGSGFMMSPMQQKITLSPSESFSASFIIKNTNSNNNDIDYSITIQPFYVNESYETVFENVNDSGQLSSWITLNSPDSGRLSPNEMATIYYSVQVPSDAPAGGQYAAINVASTAVKDNDTQREGIFIENEIKIAHLIFAEITGHVIKQGEVVETNVPSILLSDGKITGSASIKNTGNVHGVATYKLQVFPLFSDEEIYTNEENPETHMILPDRTLYNEISWDKTPAIGIFNVVYTVEFEGVVTQVSKMVIKCPIWLLFIIIFVIAAIIIYIIAKARKRNNKKETA